MPDHDNGEQLAARFEDLLRGVDHAQTSTTKYRQFEEFLGPTLDILPGAIYTSHIAKAGNFDVRMTQSDRARNASFRVALVPNELDLSPVAEQAARLAAERNPGTSVLVVFDSPTGWRPWWGIEASPENAGAAGRPAGDMNPLERVLGFRLQRYPYQPVEAPVPRDQETGSAIRAPRNPIAAIPPIVDPRIRRMLRNAVASSNAIMLIGPPGTGKSTLVEEIVRESAADPVAYGLSCRHDLSVVTPDESWTARDLVGGISVEADGQLKFAAAIWRYYGQESPYQLLTRPALGYHATPLGADILLVIPQENAYAFECKYGEISYIARDGYLQAVVYGHELRMHHARSVTSCVVGPDSKVGYDRWLGWNDVTIGIIGPRHIQSLEFL